MNRPEKIPTPRLKKAIALACRYADERGDQYLGTEHLLVGLVRSECPALKLLSMMLGLSDAEMRRQIEAMVQDNCGRPPPTWSHWEI